MTGSSSTAVKYVEVLLDRCKTLGPYLHAAIDAVEAELGIEATEPSAERAYVGHEPIGYFGDSGTSGPAIKAK